MARVDPLPPGEWPPEMRDALAALRPANPRHAFPEPSPGRPKGLGVLGTLAHHPELATAYHTFNGHILFATRLTPRQRELVVLRVAAVRESAYEWAQHAVLAADVGINADELESVREGGAAPGWDPLEAALLDAVDELLADARMTDSTWDTLSAEFDTEALMDLIFTAGAYDTLAMMFGTFQTDLDDDLL